MSPEYMQALMAGAKAPSQQQNGRVRRTNRGLVLTDKPRGRGGFATSLISEASGTGGAVGGAAAGAALGSVVPILGTIAGGVIGAGVGGFLGGTAGRAVENKVRDDEYRVGDALKEGAVSGVLGAGGQGFQAIRGAKALSAADDVTKAAKGATATERAAQGMFADAWGTKAGTKVGGTVLSPQEATKINSFITTKLGVPKTASAEQVLEKAFQVSDESGTAIKSLVTANNRQLNKAEFSSIKRAMENRLNKLAGVEWQSNPRAGQLFKQLDDTASLEDLHNFRVSIDKGINFSRNSASPDPIYEQIAKEFRDELGGFVKKAVPDVKPFQSTYANAQKVIDVTAPSARSPRGINILNNKIGGTTTQRTKAFLGNTLTGASNVTKGVRPIAGKGVRFAGGMTARGIANNTVNPPQSLEEAMLMQDQSWPNNATTMTNTMNPSNSQPNIDELYQDGTDMSSSTFSPENVDANVQHILANGGDLKDVEQFVSLVDAITQIKGAGANSKPMSSEAAKTQSNALAGLEAIQDFEGAVSSNPSGFRNTMVPGRSLFGGAIGSALGTGEVDAASQQIIDVIARLRTGAAISKEEEDRFKKFIPRPGDSDGVRSQKLGYLSRQFERVAGNVGSPSLEEAVYSSQYGY